MKPSEMLAAKPDTLARAKAAQRAARAGPSRAVTRGLKRSAESSRFNTNQFSTQPAMMLEENSSTPVKAANSALGPSSVSECKT